MTCKNVVSQSNGLSFDFPNKTYRLTLWQSDTAMDIAHQSSHESLPCEAKCWIRLELFSLTRAIGQKLVITGDYTFYTDGGSLRLITGSSQYFVYHVKTISGQLDKPPSINILSPSSMFSNTVHQIISSKPQPKATW